MTIKTNNNRVIELCSLTESHTSLLFSCSSKSSFKKLASPPVKPASSYREQNRQGHFSCLFFGHHRQMHMPLTNTRTWLILSKAPFLGKMAEFLVSMDMVCCKDKLYSDESKQRFSHHIDRKSVV